MTIFSRHKAQVSSALTDAERQLRSFIQETADELEAAIQDYQDTYRSGLMVMALDLEHLPGKHNQQTHGRPGIGLGKKLAAKLKKDGGFTFSLYGKPKSPKTGFALSIHKNTEAVVKGDMDDHEAATALRDYARTHRTALKAKNTYIGGWHNPEDGQVYLDVSTVVKSRDEAIRLGRANNQLAIYDLGKGETITIEATEHLPGKHDQQSHAGKGGGSRGSAKSPPKFGSAKEAEDWLNNNFPGTTFALGKMDKKLAQHLAEDHAKLAHKYPGAAGMVKRVEMITLDRNSLRAKVRDANDPDFDPTVNEYKTWKPDELVIHLNANKYGEGSIEGFENSVWADSKNGWGPRNSGEARTIYIHEFGHVVDMRMHHASTGSRDAVATFKKSAMQQGRIASRYGSTHEAENFAETFLDLQLSNGTPASISMEKLLMDYQDVL